jgi:hypothetical protein
MCGICGIMTTSFIANKEFDVFKNLLYISSFRGEDSTGVFSVDKKDQTGINWKETTPPSIKSLEPSYAFLKRALAVKTKEPYFDTIYRKRVLVGHCRAATKGNINEKNIHPFEFDNVIGVHNGTIHPKFKHTDEYDTDSEALYRNINDDGIDAALNEVAFPGTAYALVYFDKKQQTMNFIRNSARPLYFTFTDDYRCLMWASEDTFINFVTDRMNIKTLPWVTKASKTPDVFTLKDNHLLTIPVDSNGSLNPNMEHINYREVKIKPRPLAPTKNITHYGKDWKNGRFDPPWDDLDKMYPFKKYDAKQEKKGQKWTQKDGWVPIDNNGEEIRENKGVIQLYKKTYNNAYIPFREFEHKLDDGCCICGSVEDAKEKNIEDKIKWYDANSYVCTTCLEEELIKQTFEDNTTDLVSVVSNLN